jgi:hypothetical protein
MTNSTLDRDVPAQGTLSAGHCRRQSLLEAPSVVLVGKHSVIP